VAITVAVIAATMAAVLIGGGPVGAQSTQPPPITDYTTFPQPLPNGCPGGAGVLVDVRYDNGRGGTTTDLRALDLRAGDTLTATWADVVAGCKAPDGTPNIVIGIAAYDAGAPLFDPAVDQHLLAGWNVCGAGQGPCTVVDGRYRLTIAVPTAEVTCNVQVGVGIGLPLAVVGPNGSFYTPEARDDQGPNLLIGAANFATTPCPPPGTGGETVTTTPTATTPTTTPTTVPPATTSTPATTAPTEQGVAAVAAATATATPTGAAAAEAARPLPTTGAQGTVPVALLGGLLILLGAAAVVVERRHH
jgi:LPXTG-motif cell wall-anchored protein